MACSPSESSSALGAKTEGDLPFADPADVLELSDTLFSSNDISSWASGQLPAEVEQLRVLNHARSLRRDPPKKPQAVSPPPLRRRMRYYITRRFDADVAVAAAPAARSSRRFTERSAISDVESLSWNRWPEVITTIAALGVAIWVISSL